MYSNNLTFWLMFARLTKFADLSDPKATAVRLQHDKICSFCHFDALCLPLIKKGLEFAEILPNL